MAVSIIHLTDIHLKTDSNFIESRIDELKKACCSSLSNRTPVFIVITGDIAYSGKVEEYIKAYDILKQIKDYLVDQKNSEVKFIIVPGNHDCDFSQQDSIRMHLFKSLNIEQIDSSFINKFTEIQKNYKDFSESFNCKMDQDISIHKEFIFEDGKILFILINSAWMSELHETPGKLVIPTTFLPNISIENYKVVVSVMHHPTNWLAPDNAHGFREYLRRSTDLLLVGHEHVHDEYTTVGKKWSIKEMHGKELQGDNDNESSFVVYNFDDSFKSVDSIEFNWDASNNIYSRGNQYNQPFSKNSVVLEKLIYPNKITIEKLNDIGLVLNHFSAEDIVLPELYIWPEMELIDFQPNSLAKKTTILANPELLLKNKITIIVGESLIGKSSLGKMIYLDQVNRGKCCLIIDGDKITSYTETKLISLIENHFCDQYSDEMLEGFRQLSIKDKTIIIDGFDDLKFHNEKRTQVTRFLRDSFENILFILNSEMNIPMVLSSLENVEEGCVQAYRLAYFGNLKRKELVRKWYYLRDDEDNNIDKERKIDSSIDLLDKVLGYDKKFIPATPMLIFNVLQNKDAISTNFNGSQYGFLYESLINRSLSTISRYYKNAGEVNIDINILSSLAFEMLENSRTYFTSDDLSEVVLKIQKQKKLDLDPKKVFDRMLEAKIICEDVQANYKFKYPYIFYYFSGRYIAYNIDEQRVNDRVLYMSTKLYNEQYGNIIIFVCHFAKSIDLIETILVNAYSSLDKYEVFDFNKNRDIFANAQSIIDKLLIPENIRSDTNVEANKHKKLARMDEIGIQDGSVKKLEDSIHDEISDKERDLASISASVKIMDVLGQILQNYPGEIDGDMKIDIISEVYNLGMRVINALISTVGLIEKDLINFLVDKAKEDGMAYTHEEIADRTKTILSVLLAGVVRGMINRIASSLSGDYLLPALTESFQREDSISKKLIYQEIRFNYLRNPDINEAIKIYNEINSMSTPFAVSILQSTVGNYLKYNECDFRTRDKLCDTFSFDKRKALAAYEKQKKIQ